MNRYEFRTKPRKCPACGSGRVARILWGLPAYSDKLQDNMDAGRIVLGGCCLMGDDPEWQCVECAR